MSDGQKQKYSFGWGRMMKRMRKDCRLRNEEVGVVIQEMGGDQVSEQREKREETMKVWRPVKEWL